MARAFSLLLALALSPVAHALGVIEPPCPCAAKEERTCDIAGTCDTFQLPKGECEGLEPDTVTVQCTGVFTCLPPL